MVVILRILFGVVVFVIFLWAAIFLGTWVSNHTDEPSRLRVMNAAYAINTLLLAVFFTLWCVKMGVV